MNEIQFHFNPLTPIPQAGGSKFSWGQVLFGLGLFALIIATVYATSNPDEEGIPEKPDKKPSKD